MFKRVDIVLTEHICDCNTKYQWTTGTNIFGQPFLAVMCNNCKELLQVSGNELAGKIVCEPNNNPTNTTPQKKKIKLPSYLSIVK